MTDDGHFGEDVAATYDQDHGGTDPTSLKRTVDCLTDLAGGGDVLEFAIGTGRVALPLAERGVPTKGIELSRAMVRKLREKETGPPIEVAVGDMTSTRVSGLFSLVFLVFNTIDNLTTQTAQMACFENAARHLGPQGRFVIETLVPPIQKIPFGETKRAFANSPSHFGIDEFDVVSQTYTSRHVWMKDGRHVHQSMPFRYAWPAELDLMARLAGMTLEHRWSDWDRAPFDHLSPKHVSVWRKR